MRLVLYGGFGEKGRTCVGVECDGYRVLLDAGVKTSARGEAAYYPALGRDEVGRADALVFTHAHEDHVAALGWCLANGFAGRVLMTPQSRRELDAALRGYATPSEARAVDDVPVHPLPLDARDAGRLGPLRLATGRSGHVAGGVWIALDDGRTRFVYCGDVVPASPVFVMDEVPRCDAIALDASYGDDDVPFARRAAAIGAWVAAHPQGCALPTPLYGRSAELLALVPAPAALAPGMRAALRAQLDDRAWLREAAVGPLEARLAQATDWEPADALPAAPLLCHDGMGIAGPSAGILAQAAARRHPTLFTGHVPDGSPGAAMLAAGAASWLRLPTHPTLRENAALAIASGARVVLGHSCDPAALARLARGVPGLRAGTVVGDRIEL